MRKISSLHSTHIKESAEAIERLKFREAKQKKKIQISLHSVLGKRYGICTLMSVVFCHKLALFKRGIFILQHMTNTESVAIESSLLTKLFAVTAQKFPVQRRRVDVLSLKHNVRRFGLLFLGTNINCERNKFTKN